jgi:hypothetical protein
VLGPDGSHSEGQAEPDREDSEAHGRTVGRWAIQSREAWNLSLEFSRNGRFQSEELVPLPPIRIEGFGTRSIGWRTNVHGIQLEVRSVE